MVWLSTLIDKDLHANSVSELLHPLKQVPVREISSPTLHSGVLPKMNGDFDSMAASFTGLLFTWNCYWLFV